MNVNVSLIYSWNDIYFRQKLYGKSKHILNSVTFPEYRAVLRDKVEKYCTARQATDDNTTHAHCMLGN